MFHHRPLASAQSSGAFQALQKSTAVFDTHPQRAASKRRFVLGFQQSRARAAIHGSAFIQPSVDNSTNFSSSTVGDFLNAE